MSVFFGGLAQTAWKSSNFATSAACADKTALPSLLDAQYTVYSCEFPLYFKRGRRSLSGRAIMQIEIEMHHCRSCTMMHVPFRRKDCTINSHLQFVGPCVMLVTPRRACKSLVGVARSGIRTDNHPAPPNSSADEVRHLSSETFLRILHGQPSRRRARSLAGPKGTDANESGGVATALLSLFSTAGGLLGAGYSCCAGRLLRWGLLFSR